jgi:7,8-dihydropterin-6-yl-methyl-4-(beta-D-ribofuranosyl)aminobenzene 5'-phosphate synthase
MNMFNRLTCLLLLLGLSTLSARGSVHPASPDGAVHLTIIYDNYQAGQNLVTDWGFACLIEYQDQQLLFDAGRNAELYRKNVEILGIEPAQVPVFFLSHEHGDHTAGIPWIAEVNPSIKCYLPGSSLKTLKTHIKLPANSEGISKPTHLYGPFYSTGDDFVNFKEQGLVIKTETGGVLITGCGHPGAVEMVRMAREELGIEVHTLIGGLHLLSTPEAQVDDIAKTLQEMGIRQICPTHCTGDKSIAVLKASFGDGYITGGTGKEIIIE